MFTRGPAYPDRGTDLSLLPRAAEPSPSRDTLPGGCRLPAELSRRPVELAVDGGRVWAGTGAAQPGRGGRKDPRGQLSILHCLLEPGANPPLRGGGLSSSPDSAAVSYPTGREAALGRGALAPGLLGGLALRHGAQTRGVGGTQPGPPPPPRRGACGWGRGSGRAGSGAPEGL